MKSQTRFRSLILIITVLMLASSLSVLAFAEDGEPVRKHAPTVSVTPGLKSQEGDVLEPSVITYSHPPFQKPDTVKDGQPVAGDIPTSYRVRLDQTGSGGVLVKEELQLWENYEPGTVLTLTLSEELEKYHKLQFTIWAFYNDDLGSRHQLGQIKVAPTFEVEPPSSSSESSSQPDPDPSSSQPEPSSESEPPPSSSQPSRDDDDDDDDTITIPDPQVPLGDGGLITILDGQVPLGALPKTGRTVASFGALGSALLLLGLVFRVFNKEE